MVADVNFTTGPATLPDVGTLSYNGCEFSPLFETAISGVAVKDSAQRTVKYMEYTLTADGYVTLPAGAASISGTMATLRDLLTAQGGELLYHGRGLDLTVNPVGRLVGNRDVAWGPVPEVLDFQPLGGGLSAKIKWQCKVHVPELPAISDIPILQFNYETVVAYGEDGYSALSIRGTLEIAMTRSPTQKARTLSITVDDLRNEVEKRMMAGIDLTRFRVAHREFNVSRDKRTLEWSFNLEEKPYMDLPPDCTVARGTYGVRPAKAGMGLCLWLCTLRATYTVRADRPRRTAWLAFLALLRLRMAQSQLGNVPPLGGQQNPGRGALNVLSTVPGVVGTTSSLLFWSSALKSQKQPVADSRKAWLIDLSIDEGLYLDSKTVSFSATWRLVTTISHILLASGLWKKLPERDTTGTNFWAASVRDISGSQSWLPNVLDPKLDVIVDFGGG